MCLLGRAFRFAQEAPSDTAVKIPADVCDELFSCALSLAVASTDIRAPVRTRVICSDATPTALGTVESTVSHELSESPRRAEGGRTRDWTGAAFTTSFTPGNTVGFPRTSCMP